MAIEFSELIMFVALLELSKEDGKVTLKEHCSLLLFYQVNYPCSDGAMLFMFHHAPFCLSPGKAALSRSFNASDMKGMTQLGWL